MLLTCMIVAAVSLSISGRYTITRDEKGVLTGVSHTPLWAVGVSLFLSWCQQKVQHLAAKVAVPQQTPAEEKVRPLAPVPSINGVHQPAEAA